MTLPSGTRRAEMEGARTAVEFADAREPERLSYRVSVVTMLAGSLVILIFALSTLIRPIAAPPPALDARSPRPSEPVSLVEASVIELMRRSASEEGEKALRRSNLLLFSGIVLAMLGLTLYYFALEKLDNPSGEARPGWQEAWIFGRGLGMLVFVEGLAIFFFRQYRNAIEDYKAFYGVRVRRENWSAAHDLLLGDMKELDVASRERLVGILLADSHHFDSVESGRAFDGGVSSIAETGAALAARLPSGILQRLPDTVREAFPRRSSKEE